MDWRCRRSSAARPRHGVVYSRAELGGLVRRAEELGVTIVPEVDIPGHCYCVLQAIPALRDPGETGIYRSIQYFPNDALNPAVPGTYDFLEAVLGELAASSPPPGSMSAATRSPTTPGSARRRRSP